MGIKTIIKQWALNSDEFGLHLHATRLERDKSLATQSDEMDRAITHAHYALGAKDLFEDSRYKNNPIIAINKGLFDLQNYIGGCLNSEKAYGQELAKTNSPILINRVSIANR